VAVLKSDLEFVRLCADFKQTVNPVSESDRCYHPSSRNSQVKIDSQSWTYATLLRETGFESDSIQGYRVLKTADLC
jgi:hypothetical protein